MKIYSDVSDGKGVSRTIGLTRTVIDVGHINVRLSLPLWYGQRHIPERSLSWLRGGGSYHYLSVGIFFPLWIYPAQGTVWMRSGVRSPKPKMFFLKCI